MAYRPHRTAKQWQQLIDRQSHSSQSAREFCADHDIGYASFIQWRSRLTPSASSKGMSVDSAPEFIELTSGLDEHRHQKLERLDVASPILIELDLGGGLQLRISRDA